MNEELLKIADWIKTLTGLEHGTQAKLAYTLLAVLILFLLKSLAGKMIRRQTEDPEKRYFGGKIVSYTFMFLVILVLLRLWFDASGSLMNIFALISAALTISLQDLVKTLAGWVYILSRKPFKVGDRIQIGTYSGDVIDISPFQFTINETGNGVGGDQSTGRVIHIPNNVILNQSLINSTEDFPFIWCELPLVVTFDSDWKKAKGILQQIIDQAGAETAKKAEKSLANISQKYMLLYRKLNPTVYTSVKPERGIVLTARFLVEPRLRRDSEQQVWEKLLEQLASQTGITLIK